LARAKKATPATRRPNPKGSGDKLRGELLAAANEVLDRTGDPASVTIRGIAAAVGVAPNAVYLHFADRAALLVALVEDRFAAFGDHIRAATAGAGDDPVERLRVGHAAYVSFAMEHPGHYRLLFGGDDAGAGALEHGLDAFELLVAGCRDVVASGRVGDVDPRQLAAALWAFEHGYVELARTARGALLPGPVEALDVLLAAMMRT
jgi:AcrR family transcriptional regulator